MGSIAVTLDIFRPYEHPQRGGVYSNAPLTKRETLDGAEHTVLR